MPRPPSRLCVLLLFQAVALRLVCCAASPNYSQDDVFCCMPRLPSGNVVLLHPQAASSRCLLLHAMAAFKMTTGVSGDFLFVYLFACPNVFLVTFQVAADEDDVLSGMPCCYQDDVL